MGIFEERCFGVECDNCGEVHEESVTGFRIFVDECAATDGAYEDGWKEIDGNWYCPECIEKLFVYDEETDEYKRKE